MKDEFKSFLGLPLFETKKSFRQTTFCPFKFSLLSYKSRMKSIFLPKTTTLLRTVLLFGLLNGLLFSCGEGIRLFPFPTLATATQSQFESRINGENKYEKNLHRFENRSAAYQAKTQQSKDNHWLGSANLVKDPPFDALVNLPPSGLSFQSNFALSHCFKQQIGSRAPPLS